MVWCSIRQTQPPLTVSTNVSTLAEGGREGGRGALCTSGGLVVWCSIRQTQPPLTVSTNVSTLAIHESVHVVSLHYCMGGFG